MIRAMVQAVVTFVVALLVFLFVHPTVATTFDIPMCAVVCHTMRRADTLDRLYANARLATLRSLEAAQAGR